MNKTLLLVASLFISYSSFANDKPNVLFISIDDLRPELNCYGKKGLITPNIDKFSKSATSFTNAYTQFAVCGPSRAAVMTSIRPHRSKILGNAQAKKMRDYIGDALTIPQYFTQNGYYSVGYGKVYHYYKIDEKESWDECFGLHWDKYADKKNRDTVRRRSREAREKGLVGVPLFNATRGPSAEAVAGPDNIYNDGKLAEKAVEKLRVLSQQEKPFFFAVGFTKPHLPFTAPQKY